MQRIFRIVRLFRLDRLLLVRGSAHAFTDYFKGLENKEAVKRIFGARTNEVLRSLKVEFTFMGYMWINSANGHIVINSRYLNEGDRVDVYLDLIHELVHVRQFMGGKNLFDDRLSYVEKPTEIEAYRHAVDEARRLGLSDERICQYLKTEWMSDYDLKRLARILEVKCQ